MGSRLGRWDGKTVVVFGSLAEQYYFHEFFEQATALGVQCFIFDLDRIASGSQFSMLMNSDGRSQCSLAVSYFLSCGHWRQEVIKTSSISLGWYLRAKRPEPSRSLNETEQKFAGAEIVAAVESLLSVIPIQWVNSREAVLRVECNKLLQQKIAAAHGLRVPETIVTNDIDGLSRFAPDQQQLLFKMLSGVELEELGNFGIYSELYDRRELATLAESVSLCPVYGQVYVPKKYEYRVMFIGGEFLATRIDSQRSSHTKVDWRHYSNAIAPHERANLPKAVEDKLSKTMEAMHLRYGAIDLIETPEGEFVFLEVNPNGQWDWIRSLTGYPIPSAVAGMLAKLA